MTGEHHPEQDREAAPLLLDRRPERLHVHVDVHVRRRGLAHGASREPGRERRERLPVPAAHEAERGVAVRGRELADVRVVVARVVGVVGRLRVTRGPTDEERPVARRDELVVLGDDERLRGLDVAHSGGHRDRLREERAGAGDGDGDVDRSIEVGDRTEVLARDEVGDLLGLGHRELGPPMNRGERCAELRDRSGEHEAGRRGQRAQVRRGRQRDGSRRRGRRRWSLRRGRRTAARDRTRRTGGAGCEEREERAVAMCEGTRLHGFARQSIRERNWQSSVA